MNSADEFTDEPRYDAFISYARDDHDDIVRPLYERLTELGLRVWYDKTEVKVGDSITDSIRRGMRDSEYGIVVLSAGVFDRAYPKHELQGFLRKHLTNERGRTVLLPLYRGIDEEDVATFDPSLADIHAITITEENVGTVAEALYEVITEDRTEAAPPSSEGTRERGVDETAAQPDETVVDVETGPVLDRRDGTNLEAIAETQTGTGTDLGPSGPRVFLSHSKADRLVVNEIKDNLESNGVDVYIYEDDRRPGGSIPDKVQNAIDGSDLMVAIQTPYSADSQWIRDEMVWAVARDVPLVPILESSLSPPGGILGKDIEVVKYTLGEEGRLIRDLMEALEDHTIGDTEDEIRELGTIMGTSIGRPLERLEDPEATPDREPQPVSETPETPLRERIRERIDRKATLADRSEVIREEVVAAIEGIQDEHGPGPVPDAFWEAVLEVYEQTMSTTSRETIAGNFETLREAYRNVILVEPGPVPAAESRSGHVVSVNRPWRPTDLYTEGAWRERVAALGIPEAVQPHVVVCPDGFTDDWLHTTQHFAHVVGVNALAVDRELAREQGRKPLWKLLGELGEVPSGTLGRIGFVVSSNVRSMTTLFQAMVREYLGYLVLREAFRSRQDAT